MTGRQNWSIAGELRVMKHLFILLFMLAALPCQAADKTPADAGNTGQAEDLASGSQKGNSGQTGDTATQSDDGKKPDQKDEEEEPDCE